MISGLRQAGVLSAGWLMVLAAGCAGGDNRPVPDAKQQATVTGSVTNNGKALPIDFMVVFSSKDKGAIGSGKLDSLGKFTIRGGDAAIGLPAGRYQVKLAPPPPPVVSVSEAENYKAVMMGKVKSTVSEVPKDIPAKFLSWDTSGLVFEVNPGPNNFDIDLAKLPK